MDDKDKGMEKRFDDITEDDVRKGFRLKTLPEAVYNVLVEVREAEPTIPDIRRVRFTKLTPKKRRLANEEVIKRYHADLQKKDLLSTEQLKKLNIERGEWSVEKDKRIQYLTDETNRLMKQLHMEGVDKRDQWGPEIIVHAEQCREYLASVKEGEDPSGLPELRERFERWLEFSADQQNYYDAMYAESQGRDTYSAEADWRFMTDNTPHIGVVDCLNAIEELKLKLRRYVECLTLRGELMELQLKQGKMLAESVEQRRDTCDELARLFFCTERVDEKGMPQGPVTATFEQMWELPDEVINWLLIQIYFFFQGTPDVEEATEFLETWGFIVAPPKTTSDEPKPVSDGSRAEPSSNIDSLPLGETPAGSSD